MLRFDALSLAMVVLLAAGAVADLVRGPRRPARWLRCLAAIALACAVAASGDLRVAAVGLAAVAAVAGETWWQRGAGLIQAAPLLALGVAAGSWGWGDLAVGAAFRSAHVLLLLIGGSLAAGILPLRVLPAPSAALGAAPQAPMAALALSGLYPLLRMYQLGPINWGWTIAAALVGGGSALWHGLAALRATGSPQPEIPRSLAILALWGAAMAPIGLATEAGIAAAWTLAAAAILVSGTGRRAAVCLPNVWLGLWLAAAATLAGGVPLLGAAFWLLLVVLSMALIGLGPPGTGRWRTIGAALPAGLAALLLPKALGLIVKPAWTRLGAGLTPFGRLNLWPWLGLEVRNAGSETVATLPGLALAGLMLVALAIGFLLLRSRRVAVEAPPLDAGDASAAGPAAGFWRLVASQLPTAVAPPKNRLPARGSAAERADDI